MNPTPQKNQNNYVKAGRAIESHSQNKTETTFLTRIIKTHFFRIVYLSLTSNNDNVIFFFSKLFRDKL